MSDPAGQPAQLGSAAAPPTTALVVVDMQVDFGRPDGALFVAGSDAVLPVVRDWIARATEADWPVFYTQDWHPPKTPHFVTDGGLWPVHCVRDTAGAALLPGLPVTGPVVRKGADGRDGYSGFSVRDPRSGAVDATELGSLVAATGVRELVVVGLAGDWCVKETALDGRRLGYAVRVPLAATAFVNLEPGADETAVAQLRAAGVDIA
jgi:nicotinamidase/pyrazinamidase